MPIIYVCSLHLHRDWTAFCTSEVGIRSLCLSCLERPFHDVMDTSWSNRPEGGRALDPSALLQNHGEADSDNTWDVAFSRGRCLCCRCSAVPHVSLTLQQARFHGNGTWRPPRVGTGTATSSTFCLSKPVMGQRNIVCIRVRPPKSCDKGYG